MTAASRSLERVLRRDRAVAVACLVFVIALSWAYILSGAGMNLPAMPAGGMAGDDGGMSMSDVMMSRGAWSPEYAILMLVMWWVMMLAMMLPSAAPMILLYAVINRKNGDGSPLAVATFALAYAVAWGGFSVIAMAAQWGLEKATLLSPMMASTSVLLGGVLLIAAGIWQLTPLKYACLRHCRSPIHFFAHGWRPGAQGAFRMGLEHGAFCLGCCWVLMALLFYGGVMNLWWIVGLAVYVLVEKVAPAGQRFGRYTGALLIVWGVWVIAGAA